MSGALLQLSAIGPQDAYLTQDYEGTLFKKSYKRVSPHAREHVLQNFSGAVDFGRRATCTVSRTGDLCHRVYLKTTLPALTGSGTQAWTRNIGNVMIKEVEVEIGNIRVDRQYGQFMHIWAELTETGSMFDAYNVMVGNTAELTTEAASIPSRVLYVPLRFWFCREIGLSLPLVALQYHDVKINVEFRPFSELYVSSSGAVSVPTLSDAALLVEYVYLDTDERKRMAQVAHEYLIEQVQHSGAESFAQTSVSLQVNINQPVKSLFWVVQPDANVSPVSSAGGNANRWTDFTDNGSGPNPYEGSDFLVRAKLLIANQDRFAEQDAAYFNLLQPYQHFTRGPATGIYVYSFAENPEAHQPSGTLNFSRINTSNLNMTLSSSAACKAYLYATNYNVLRVLGGIAGVSYSA